MPNKLIERLRGSLSTLLYFLNTLFWFIPILTLGLLKLLLPFRAGAPSATRCWMAVPAAGSVSTT